jgi:hypothetical protein
MHTNSLDENLIVSNEVVVVLVDYFKAVAKTKQGSLSCPVLVRAKYSLARVVHIKFKRVRCLTYFSHFIHFECNIRANPIFREYTTTC